MSDLLNRDTRRAAARTARVGTGPTPDQSRMLAAVAFKTSGLVVVIATTLVLVTLVSVNSDLTGTLGAIAGTWFAMHLVPLTIGGTSLGVAPLLPTLIIGWSVARTVHRAVDPDTDRRMVRWVFAASLAGPLAVTAIALAVAGDASTVIGLSSPNALAAFSWVAGVHAAASGTGLILARWDSLVLRRGVPEWVRALVAPFVRALSILVAGGAAVVLLALLASWETAGALVESGRDVVGMLGLTALSVLYLPNVLIGALAVATGSTAGFGDASVSLFATTGGPLPPLPILAVLPEGPAQTIWVVMLAVPIGAGLLLGRDCAIRSADIQVAASSVWVVAAAAGVLAALFGYAAGGSLGTFGTVEVTVWSFGLLTFAWLAVAGTISAAIVVWRRAEPEAEPEHDEPASTVVPAAEVAIEAAPAAEPKDGPDVEDVVEAEVVDELPAEPAQEPVAEPAVDADTDEPLDAEIVAPPGDTDGPAR
ncbi:cell division protein PerM [Rhodococcus sp. IEGM1428]|uniref:cell division protein PerM n=1 Tax=Rhodococcus sp. IEGM1428 TaxID=3392191 RepID=UPI003D13834A